MYYASSQSVRQLSPGASRLSPRLSRHFRAHFTVSVFCLERLVIWPRADRQYARDALSTNHSRLETSHSAVDMKYLANTVQTECWPHSASSVCLLVQNVYFSGRSRFGADCELDEAHSAQDVLDVDGRPSSGVESNRVDVLAVSQRLTKVSLLRLARPAATRPVM